MKKPLSLFLCFVMLLALAVPVASASAAGASITQVYASYESLYANWMYPAFCYEESYWASPVAADLDGDGKLEVVIAAYTVTAWDAATGKLKWQSDKGPSQIFCTPVVKDLDGDGKLEIAVGYGNGTVTVLDSQGNTKSGWPKTVAPYGEHVRALAADDVDGDGKQELIVGLGAGNANSLYVYSHDGNPKPGCITAKASVYCDGIWANGIATGDLDGDGLPEIIAPTDNWFINAFNADGSLVMAGSEFGENYPWCQVGLYEDYQEELEHKNGGWGQGIKNEPLDEKGRKGTYGPGMGSCIARYVDVDGDGTEEVVVSVLMMDRTNYFLAPAGTRDWTTGSKDAKYMTVAIYNQDHTRFNNGKYNWETIPTDQAAGLGGPLYYDALATSLGVEAAPVVADINGDGVNEILFNAFDGKVHCFSLSNSGKELAGWPFKLPKTTGSAFELPGQVACADLNGDGKQEVIFGSTVKDSSGQPSADGALYVVGSDGKLVASQPLHEGIEEGVNTINGCTSTPVVRDVDSDGKYEILLNTRKFGLCCYRVNMPAAVQDTTPRATPSTLKVIVNGDTAFTLNTMVLKDAKGYETNYVPARDLAWHMTDALGDQTGVFDVDWDGQVNLVTGKPYQCYPGHNDELECTQRFTSPQPYTPGTSINVNGQATQIEYFVVKNESGGGTTYYKLQDLAKAMGTFDMEWDFAAGAAAVTTK